MRSTQLCLTLGLLALSACTSAHDPDSEADSADAKLAARARIQAAAGEDGEPVSSPGASPGSTPSSGPTQPRVDECAKNKWYGDGECDAWCPEGDAKDCAGGSGSVACALFFSPKDGKCDRTDPCGPVQDEDCAPGSIDPNGPVQGPTPTPGDGKCAPTSAAEFKADPDCQVIACPALFSPADGKCNARTACDYVIDEDCAASGGGGNTGGPVACIEIAFAANGKCEAAPGCEYTDPKDCPVACIDIAHPKDGKCTAAPGCEANDPDCVSCDAILYPKNGKCEAPPGCEANDPGDCGVACILILYPKNGKCEAAPGCEASDPGDC